MTTSSTTATKGTVYALIDPRDGVTRYIGQTTRSLTTRLAGHMSKPAPSITAWITELKAAGLRPAIAPLHQDVPASILLRLEREEITRRLLDGEKLLNSGSTGDARKAFAKLEEEQRKARTRAAWQEAAHRTRAALGGPLPPGEIPAAPFPEEVWQHMPTLWATQDSAPSIDEALQPPFDPAAWEARRVVQDAEERLSELLWSGVRAGWGAVRGRDDKVDGRLESVVKEIVSIRCASLKDAARLLTLAPWCVIAVAPWAALAKRAELSLDTDDFIAWVTDRPDVEDALRLVCRYQPGMLEHLASSEHYNDRLNPSVHLVAAAAAHTPFDLSGESTHTVVYALRALARDQMLTAAMADLLARLDPRALDDVFGKDLAAAADASLDLPEGTAAAVIKYILESSNGNYGVLERVLARAGKKLPSRSYPSYSTWSGPGVAVTQGVVETLYASGLVSAPGEPTPGEAEANARALWVCDLKSIARHAHS
ncbi:hypothetical protein ACWDCO_24770 [Streptomyces albogriseolus]